MTTVAAQPRHAPSPARRMLNKVPEVRVFFWVIKIMCTTVGETAFSIVPAAVFAAWYAVERTLSIHTIFTTRRLNLNAVLAFWLAYILTRPLGASIGDEMSQNSHEYGGLGLGTTGTSYIFLGCILALVVYLSVTRRDTTEIHRRQPLPDAA